MATKKTQKIRKAVVPVAGFGTRFLPMTIAMPKEMMPIVDKPIVQIVVEQLVASGIEEIIFVTGRNKRLIEDHFDYSGELEQLLRANNKTSELKEVHRISQMAKFVFVRQNRMLGTGHAIMMAREVIGDEPFLVCWGDDFFESRVPAPKQLIDAYNRYRSTIIGVLPVTEDRFSRYGMMKPYGRIVGKTAGTSFRISGITEKPPAEKSPSPYAMLGGAVLTPDFFTAMKYAKPSPQGELYYVDGVNWLARREKVYAHHLTGRWWDTGDKAEYIKAVIHFALRNKKIRQDIQHYITKPY